MINLFFLNPVSYGGHVTFTVHLMRGLRANGVECRLFKIGNNTEKKERSFGYGEFYRNIDFFDIDDLEGTNLITAPSKRFAEDIDLMLMDGAQIVIHDPAEFKHGWDWESVESPLVIRKSMLQYFKDARFCRHPYDRLHKSLSTEPTHEWRGVSTSRIDFDKHTELILDANRLGADIRIFGFENRIYTRFNILPHYPEWVQSIAKYPKELRYATENLCGKATFMVDMSVIKGDGGGTQYSFLEAIDTGCVLILHDEWITPDGVMQPGRNCLTASTGQGIVDAMSQDGLDPIRMSARQLMIKHDAELVCKEDWIPQLS